MEGKERVFIAVSPHLFGKGEELVTSVRAKVSSSSRQVAEVFISEYLEFRKRTKISVI
jgi:hypothetical protein